MNAADYGAATTRERLFIIARHGRREIKWPTQTHAKESSRIAAGQSELFQMPLKKWRGAEEIIDWNIRGKSVFNRERPLARNTMARLITGLLRFGLRDYVIGAGGAKGTALPRLADEPLKTVSATPTFAVAHPFMVTIDNASEQASARPVSDPVPTVITDQRAAVARPYLVTMRGTTTRQVENTARPSDEPLPAISTSGAHSAVVKPYVVSIRGGKDGYLRGAPASEPLPTPTTSPAEGIAQPFIITYHGGESGLDRSSEITAPVPVVDTSNRHGVATPFVLGQQSGSVGRPVDQPLPTLAADGAIALATPYLVPTNHGNDPRSHPVDAPMPGVTTVDAMGLAVPLVNGKRSYKKVRVSNIELPEIDLRKYPGLKAQPYIVRFNNNCIGQAIDKPLGAITTKDRFALCVPLVVGDIVVDIEFRMLTYRENARAMGFDDDYEFEGNREKKMRQIGNAVEVHQAMALGLPLFQELVASVIA